MKKLSAIFLAVLLFFTWYGYQFLYDYMQYRTSQQLETSIDHNQYDPSQLIEIRIPLNLPYHNDWNDFERYNGEIEIQGIHYKYVKRKVEKGELVLLCLPNKPRQEWQSARDEFFKLVNDLQQMPNGKKTESGNSLICKSLLSDYRQEKTDWQLTGFVSALPAFNEYNTPFIPGSYLEVLGQPPQI